MAVQIKAVDIPVPSRMIGIELFGPLRERKTAFDFSRRGQQLTEKGDGIAIHRVERGGPLRRVAERLELLLEKEYLGQTEMGQVIGWPGLDGAPRGGRPSGQRIRQEIETLAVLLCTQQRQHGPSIGIGRRLLHGVAVCGPGRETPESACAYEHWSMMSR